MHRSGPYCSKTSRKYFLWISSESSYHSGMWYSHGDLLIHRLFRGTFRAEETSKQRCLLPADCLFALLSYCWKFFPPNRRWPSDKLRCRMCSVGLKRSAPPETTALLVTVQRHQNLVNREPESRQNSFHTAVISVMMWFFYISSSSNLERDILSDSFSIQMVHLTSRL